MLDAAIIYSNTRNHLTSWQLSDSITPRSQWRHPPLFKSCSAVCPLEFSIDAHWVSMTNDEDDYADTDTKDLQSVRRKTTEKAKVGMLGVGSYDVFKE